jgi:hypothetical protein
MRGEPAGRARSTMDRRRHGPKLTGGGAKEREEHGGARLGPHRSSGGGAKRTRELGGESFRRGRGEEKGAVMCGVLRGSSGWLL